MKTSLFIVYIFIAAGAVSAATPMARVIAVNDSRTIVVTAGGRTTPVVLGGVTVDAQEEAAAAAYLHQIVDRSWVLVEGGNVYRSPDGLYVNAEMQRRAWRTIPGMRYLGEVMPGAAPTTAQPRSAKAASPSARRSRAPLPAARTRRRR